MKKVININFQGRIIPIEESAYDLLKQYVESLTNFFANEEGRDEIINDIEGRIAELFGETLKKGTTCITDDDVNRVIDSMGRPADFEAEETTIKSKLADEQQQQQGNASHEQQEQSFTNNEPKRFYRDENHKVLGGVCSGIANYFSIDPVIVRVIFLVTAFGAGFGFLAYIILWIAAPSSASKIIGSQRKRLFRDTEDKLVGGVCSGLAQYFNTSVWVPRLLFLIPFISVVFHTSRFIWWGFPHFLSSSFIPGTFFIYVILWLVIPEAKSTADKLEMKGEKVDLRNIKNTIQGDLEGLKERAEKFGSELKERTQEWGKEFGETIAHKGKQMGAEAAAASKKNSRDLGDIIVILFKVCAYFILGIVLLSVVITLFGIGVVFTGLLPAKEFVIANGWQNIFTWGTLLLFVWVPIIGIITFLIRRIAKLKGNSGLIRYSFLALWLIGLFSLIGLIASLRNDFHHNNHATEEQMTLNNPSVNKLEISTLPSLKYYERRWFKIEPFAEFDEDTVFVQNIRLRIVKSTSDSFHVTMVKLANGKTKDAADTTAALIHYNILQKDSTLILDKGIALTPNNKFRNQHIILTIAVPLGKKIKVNGTIWNNTTNFSMDWNENEWNLSNYYIDQMEEKWRNNVEYIMTAKGLERVDQRKDEDEDASPENSIENFKKSKEQILKEKEQKLKELKEIDRQLQLPTNDPKNNNQAHPPTKVEKQKTQVSASATMNYPSRRALNNDLVFMRFSI